MAAPASSEPAIAIDDVAKRFRLVHERNSTLKATVFNGFRRTTYEEFWALDGVSFDVPKGSTFGIIGHNGSGKSTLLKCLAGIYRPDRGTITHVGPGVRPARARRRLPPRAVRAARTSTSTPRSSAWAAARSTAASTTSSPSRASSGSSTRR